MPKETTTENGCRGRTTLYCLLVWGICFFTVFFGVQIEHRYLKDNDVDRLQAQVKTMLRVAENDTTESGESKNHSSPMVEKQKIHPSKIVADETATTDATDTRRNTEPKNIASGEVEDATTVIAKDQEEPQKSETPKVVSDIAATQQLPKTQQKTKSTRIASGKEEETDGSTPAINDPTYATLPKTKFTPHIKEIIQTIETVTLNLPKGSQNPWWYQPQRYCPQGYHIYVDKPYSTPKAIECHGEDVWCELLRRLFANDPTRILPYNLSLGTSNADMIKRGSMAWGQCLGSSGPEGLFSMNNFQDAKALLNGMQKNHTGYTHVHSKTWEERQKIPVFRGHARANVDGAMKNNPQRWCQRKSVANGDFGHRAKAVLLSVAHPELLDARVTTLDVHPCRIFNATNGLDQVTGIGSHSRKETIGIPSSSYYTDYQTAVVLGGIGAAFRGAQHLAAGQAMVLQRFKFEEWWYPFMEPYVHYIPVKDDLSDLQQAMEYVRDNPDKVKEIAANGKKFYEEWLSLAPTMEHWYELLWRLSETIHEKGPDRLKTGSYRTLWPAPIVPFRYVRGEKTEDFLKEDKHVTRKPYDALDKAPEDAVDRKLRQATRPSTKPTASPL